MLQSIRSAVILIRLACVIGLLSGAMGILAALFTPHYSPWRVAPWSIWLGVSGILLAIGTGAKNRVCAALLLALFVFSKLEQFYFTRHFFLGSIYALVVFLCLLGGVIGTFSYRKLLQRSFPVERA